MKALIQSSILFLLCMTNSFAQDLANLHTSFMSKYDQVNLSHDQKIETLTTGYLGALERLKKQLQNTGQLEFVLQVQSEIEIVGKENGNLEDLSEKAPPELKSLRTKFLEARDKMRKDRATQLCDAVDKMDKLLAAQITALTKAGEIEEAKLAQKMKEDLSKDVAITEARELLKESISSGALNWTMLSYDTYEIIKQDAYYVGPLIGKKGKGAEDPLVISELKKYATEEKNVFVMVPNCEVEFVAKKAFSEFRGSVILTRAAGSASIKIVISGKIVKTMVLKGGLDKAEEVSCKFPATEKITLICDNDGTLGNDTVGWVSMAVR